MASKLEPYRSSTPVTMPRIVTVLPSQALLGRASGSRVMRVMPLASAGARIGAAQDPPQFSGPSVRAAEVAALSSVSCVPRLRMNVVVAVGRSGTFRPAPSRNAPAPSADCCPRRRSRHRRRCGAERRPCRRSARVDDVAGHAAGIRAAAGRRGVRLHVGRGRLPGGSVVSPAPSASLCVPVVAQSCQPPMSCGVGRDVADLDQLVVAARRSAEGDLGDHDGRRRA